MADHDLLPPELGAADSFAECLRQAEMDEVYDFVPPVVEHAIKYRTLSIAEWLEGEAELADIILADRERDFALRLARRLRESVEEEL